MIISKRRDLSDHQSGLASIYPKFTVGESEEVTRLHALT
jgi:hypothetical protein